MSEILDFILYLQMDQSVYRLCYFLV